MRRERQPNLAHETIPAAAQEAQLARRGRSCAQKLMDLTLPDIITDTYHKWENGHLVEIRRHYYDSEEQVFEVDFLAPNNELHTRYYQKGEDDRAYAPLNPGELDEENILTTTELAIAKYDRLLSMPRSSSRFFLRLDRIEPENSAQIYFYSLRGSLPGLITIYRLTKSGNGTVEFNCTICTTDHEVTIRDVTWEFGEDTIRYEYMPSQMDPELEDSPSEQERIAFKRCGVDLLQLLHRKVYSHLTDGGSSDGWWGPGGDGTDDPHNPFTPRGGSGVLV